MIPPRLFLRVCRRNLWRWKVADSSGVRLTGAGLLTRALILRRILRREVLSEDERNVGLLLPPSVGGVLANLALTLDARVAVNLNYTVSSQVLNNCIRQCGIRQVLSSRRFMERVQLEVDAQLVYLEDFKEKVGLADKVAAILAAWLLPAAVLERRLGLTRISPDDLLTIVFTSGSTGEPKGVMLTHNNVGSNVAPLAEMIRIERSDVLLGVLPLFHSFGYTGNLWLAMLLDLKGVFHPNPLEARQVGRLCRQYGVKLLICTPTFLRKYMRGCSPGDFASLEVVLTGAERLPGDLAEAFTEKHGVRPIEGYGVTETSPVVSVNVPPSRDLTGGLGYREGTVGRPIPGVAVKIVDLDTGEDLGPEEPGILLVKGPNVMKGYLGRPKLTAAVIRDGWYSTGDVATIDAEGFIRITGRESRFSKIGGEMVPHIRIEESLNRLLHADEEQPMVAVTSIPDEKKGERLIVLHTGLEQSPEEICLQLAREGLPPIWIPSPGSFCRIDEIPVLGSGKLDLRRVKQVALEKFPGAK
jgi:acyl-[acyl-carrier-protein]-phospholipid O-acyltransferase/long-chain-fatty-acid--[acyl-carrier-protein] ligase